MASFFTYEQRLELQKGLMRHLSMKAIGKLLDKDPTAANAVIRPFVGNVLVMIYEVDRAEDNVIMDLIHVIPPLKTTGFFASFRVWHKVKS